MNREEIEKWFKVCRKLDTGISVEEITQLETFIDSQEQTIKELREENRRIKYEMESNKRLLEGFAYFKMGGKKPELD